MGDTSDDLHWHEVLLLLLLIDWSKYSFPVYYFLMSNLNIYTVVYYLIATTQYRC